MSETALCWELQSREIGKFLGGPAEDFSEPSHPLLMRYVHQVMVTEDIRQAVSAGVRLRRPLSRLNVPPPQRERQHEHSREDGCCENCRQALSSHAHYGSAPGSQSPVLERRIRLPAEQG
jgi:hypothetical protein